MTQISGFHHVSLPATDVERSGDWYERVFGFGCVLIEEEEDHVKAVILEHPAGMLLVLYPSPDLIPAPSGHGLGTAALSFRVASQNELLLWENRLTELGIDHSGPRQAHLGWALDVVDPSGLRVQLHTREVISADDE
ncbi:MAG TPA: VOC family protein [Streptosporangiaceae bacterium]|nr:VOC family protein [Streptosporangiaceae bacterium]